MYYPDFQSWFIPSDHPLYHQITRVLRARVGWEYVFFSWNGFESIITVDTIDRKWCTYTILDTAKTLANPQKYLCIAQALPNKFEKLEYIVEKWVECGVSEFIFFPSKYSQIRHLDEKKVARLQKIAMEAIEQCGRSDLVSLSALPNFPQCSKGKSIFLHTGEQTVPVNESVKRVESEQSITLFVGPEGGWNQEEAEMFYQNPDALSVNLGSRVLRLETVTPVVAFMFMDWY